MKSAFVHSCLAIAFAIFSPLISHADSTSATVKRSAPVQIALVGDSTVSDYPATHANRGWGQFIQEHFKEGSVNVINFAKPGRSTKTFIAEGIWAKTLAAKPNYILIQFGHNDSHSADKPESTEADTDYKANLRRYIDEARAINATPILITPMVRRTFDATAKIVDPVTSPKSLAAYAKAMIEVGAEKKVAVINLHQSSLTYAEKIGPEASAKLANKKGDITHFNEAGARAMADLVLTGLQSESPPLAALLKK